MSWYPIFAAPAVAYSDNCYFGAAGGVRECDNQSALCEKGVIVAVALIPNRGTTIIELEQPVTVVLFGVHMVSWK